MNNQSNGAWKNKNVLFIGDSLTERRVYPEVVKEILGINTFYHCKGGSDLIAMVDGDNQILGDVDENEIPFVLRPLNAQDVKDMDLIVFFSGYNSRYAPIGKVGDRYDGSSESQTVAGMMQYCIDRIYEELLKAENLTCKLLIATVDYSGKYPWMDVDGMGEVGGKGSGKTLKAMANIQKEVAHFNAIPVCDLFHNSGINPKTWCVFSFESESVNPDYSPYLLDKDGEKVNDERMVYVKGKSYYQWRNGKVVLEKYNGVTDKHYDAPYPYNADQLHKSEAGYRRIGEAIAGAIISSYGN